MSNYASNNDFRSILNRMLARVPDTFDKREGSIIYDALAPAAAELAQCYIALDVYTHQSYLLTATGINLDNRASDWGILRLEATYAEATIVVYDTSSNLMEVEIGKRFAVPNESGGMKFEITEKISAGTYKAVAEEAGTQGNEYVGNLLPLDDINNLGYATITAISKPAEDEETDDALRYRVLAKLNNEPFAGNVAAYKKLCADIDGVEDCKVFPIWNGGGTVKLAIIAANHTIPSQEFVDDVQTMIDPVTNHGEGLGLAPIGHTVTVVAPTEFQVYISAYVSLKQGYTIESVKADIDEQLENYIYQVQNDFIDNDEITIYISRIIAAILNVTQVINADSIEIKDLEGNIQYTDLTIQLDGDNVIYPTIKSSDIHIEVIQ